MFISLFLTEIVVASLEDNCLLVLMAPPTLYQDLSVYLTDCGKSDSVKLLKVGHKRH